MSERYAIRWRLQEMQWIGSGYIVYQATFKCGIVHSVEHKKLITCRFLSGRPPSYLVRLFTFQDDVWCNVHDVEFKVSWSK